MRHGMGNRHRTELSADILQMKGDGARRNTHKDRGLRKRLTTGGPCEALPLTLTETGATLILIRGREQPLAPMCMKVEPYELHDVAGAREKSFRLHEGIVGCQGECGHLSIPTSDWHGDAGLDAKGCSLFEEPALLPARLRR